MTILKQQKKHGAKQTPNPTEPKTKTPRKEKKAETKTFQPAIRRILQATARNKKPYAPVQMQCMTAHRAEYLEREIINRITRAVCGESRMHGS